MASLLQSTDHDDIRVTDLRDGTGPLLATVVAASQLSTEMLGPEQMRASVLQLARLAELCDLSALYGASETGHALAGAMVFANNQFHLWSPHERGHVLLIDGAIAGLAGLHLTRSRTLSLGACAVSAAFLGLVTSPDWAAGSRLLDDAQLSRGPGLERLVVSAS